jgi:hypothetical protein
MPEEESLRDGVDEAIGKSTAVLAVQISFLHALLKKRMLSPTEVQSVLTEALRITEGVPELSEQSRGVAIATVRGLLGLPALSEPIH